MHVSVSVPPTGLSGADVWPIKWPVCL